MPYLRNTVTGTLVVSEDVESDEYKQLRALRYNNFPVFEEISDPQAEAGGVATAIAVKRAVVVVAPAVATAGGDLDTSFPACEIAGTITKVEYFAAADKAGADTNSRTLKVLNGATEAASLALIASVSLVKDTPKAITLSGTPANLVVAKGDRLTWRSLHVLTGITDPGGVAVVSYA
jgi:hypothetical protein